MKLIFLSLVLASSVFATELFIFNMGQFDAVTPDEVSYNLLKKNTNCARSIVKAYVEEVVWQNDMNDGVDLSESFDFEMLTIERRGTLMTFKLYLSADEVVSGVASKARRGCLVDLK